MTFGHAIVPEVVVLLQEIGRVQGQQFKLGPCWPISVHPIAAAAFLCSRESSGMFRKVISESWTFLDLGGAHVTVLITSTSFEFCRRRPFT